MICPKIKIVETQYFHFRCAFYRGTTIPRHDCFACRLFLPGTCDVADPDFLEFYEYFKVCPRCGREYLDVLYVYIFWKLKDYLPPSKMKCCRCGEKKR